MNGYMKPILGVLLTIVAAGILGWGRFVTNSAIAFGKHQVSMAEKRKAHDAEILRLKEAQAERDARNTEHLRKIYLRLDSIDRASHSHDAH